MAFLPELYLLADSSTDLFIQAVAIVGVIPRVFDWIQLQPGVVFAFKMYSYSSSVIVVSAVACIGQNQD
jgi:hypothetical protein